MDGRRKNGRSGEKNSVAEAGGATAAKAQEPNEYARGAKEEQWWDLNARVKGLELYGGLRRSRTAGLSPKPNRHNAADRGEIIQEEGTCSRRTLAGRVLLFLHVLAQSIT